MDHRGMIACGLRLVLWGSVGAATPCLADVQVILDLDPARPGFQSAVTVQPATTAVNRVAVYVVDPDRHPIWGLGYLGGVDRGIALGHMPGNANHGSVAGLAAHLGTPVVGDNFALV